jgi:hypothetical protein
MILFNSFNKFSIKPTLIQYPLFLSEAYIDFKKIVQKFSLKKNFIWKFLCYSFVENINGNCVIT